MCKGEFVLPGLTFPADIHKALVKPSETHCDNQKNHVNNVVIHTY